MFTGQLQAHLGGEWDGVYCGAVLRIEAGQTLAGLTLVPVGAGLTLLAKVGQRLRLGATGTGGLLNVRKVTGGWIRSGLFEVSLDAKVDLYRSRSHGTLYLHLAPGYEYYGFVGSGFISHLALGFRNRH